MPVKYVAFLRGINVGGKNMIGMETLRELFVSLGFEGVKSLINSGNIIFETRKAANENLSAKIEKAIKSGLSLDVSVMVRSMPEVAELLAKNPFENKQKEGQDIFVVFLAGKLSADQEKLLLSQNRQSEMFAVDGPNVFCLMDRGFPDSLLGKKFIDNKLKTPATARNIKTVRKAVEM